MMRYDDRCSIVDRICAVDTNSANTSVQSVDKVSA